MKLKRILQSVTFVAMAQALIVSAGTNLYSVLISGQCVQTNSNGQLSETCYGSRQIISRCAAEHGVTNLADLRLVYDQDQDSIRVVTVTNAVALCEVISFEGGESLSNSNGTSTVRLAFVFLPGDNTARGTITGRETIRTAKARRGWHKSGGFNFSGQFQFGSPATATEGAKICSGFLSTGARFEPVISDAGGGGGTGPTVTSAETTAILLEAERNTHSGGGLSQLPKIPRAPSGAN